MMGYGRNEKFEIQLLVIAGGSSSGFACVIANNNNMEVGVCTKQPEETA